MAISNFHKTDEYGFERPDEFDYNLYDNFFSQYLKVLAKRAKKWEKILKASANLRKGRLLKRYIRKGIPGSQRGLVWLAIAGMNAASSLSLDIYQQLLSGDLDPSIVETIKTDLPRTFPSNIFFNQEVNRQCQLYNILVAFAHHNTNVGYCQGLNYIAGLLLLATNCESTSFWLLRYLVEDVLPPYYTRTMDGLVMDIDVLAELVHEKIPDVYQHVVDMGLPWAVIFTKWFVCLFAEVLPTETVYRIWDSLFYEGSKVLFRVGLTLIHTHRTQIMESSDFTALAECFRNMTTDQMALDCHTFMQNVFTVPGKLSNSRINYLREQFKNKKSQEIKVSK